MEDQNILNSDELKEFRKLGVVNWVIRILIALGVGALLYWLLPYGVSIAENSFQMALNLGGTFLIGGAIFLTASFLWFNRSLLKKIRDSLSRQIWKNWIYKDPTDYIQGVIEEFTINYQKIQLAIQLLRKVALKLRSMGEDLVAQARGNMNEAKAIMDEEKNEQKANLYAYMSNARMESTSDIVNGYNDIMDSIDVMTEFGESVSIRIEKMKFDLEMMNLNLEVTDAKSQAALAAQSVLDDKSMEAARLEFAKNAYKDKLAAGAAQFQQFMTRIKPILDSDHIEKVIATKAGRDILDQFRKGVDIAGLKSFDEQLESFKMKNQDIFSKTTARERVTTQRAETIRTGNSGRFANLS